MVIFIENLWVIWSHVTIKLEKYPVFRLDKQVIYNIAALL